MGAETSRQSSQNAQRSGHRQNDVNIERRVPSSQQTDHRPGHGRIECEQIIYGARPTIDTSSANGIARQPASHVPSARPTITINISTPSGVERPPPVSQTKDPLGLNVFPASSRDMKPTTATTVNSGIVKPNQACSGIVKPTIQASSGIVNSTYQASSGIVKPTNQASSGIVKPTNQATSGIVKPTNQATSGIVKPTSQTSSGIVNPCTQASSGIVKPSPQTSSGIVNLCTQASSGVAKPTGQASGFTKTTTSAPYGAVIPVVSSTNMNTPTMSLYPDLNDDSLISDKHNRAKYIPPTRPTRKSKVELQGSMDRVNNWQETSSPSSSGIVKGGGPGVEKIEDPSGRAEPSPKPSCPDFFLLEDWEEGAGGRWGSSPFVSQGSRNTMDLGSATAEKSGNPFVFVNEDREKGSRDPSPVGSECSRQSGFSAASGNQQPNRNRKKPRKPKNKPMDTTNEPPKYEDVIAQQRKENNNPLPSRKHIFQRQFDKGPGNYRNGNFKKGADNSLGGRWPKNIDSLNDLIKKEFGSVGRATYDLPAMDAREKLFSGRNCLFVGNLPFNISRDDVNELIAPYGEIVVDHHNVEKKFGFVRLKHREQANRAQQNLDGYIFKGRSLRVRHANKNTCLKVTNLDRWVTNELLKKAFSAFGEVERAEIIVKGGQPTGEGILEFTEKRAGKTALEACVEHCFLLTSSLRPVILEEIDPDQCSRRYSESQINRNNQEYRKSREVGPRFAAEGSQENNCALLWKSFHEHKKRQEEEFAKKLEAEERIVEKQIRSMMQPICIQGN